MTATLARSYDHRNPLVAGSQGNVQALADGDWMVGWGQAGYVSEGTRRAGAVQRAPAAQLGVLPRVRAAVERAPG